MRAYCVILSNYRNNPSSLNHAVVKMLFRIAFELKMAPLLYQISIFRIFLSILQEPNSPRTHVSQHYFCLWTTNFLDGSEIFEYSLQNLQQF